MQKIPHEIEVLMDQYVQSISKSTLRPIGTYVVGSIALGAYDEDHSDIDCITILEGDRNAGYINELAWVHEMLNESNPLGRKMDGTYVRRSQLGKISDSDSLAFVRDGKFQAGIGDINAVTWWILQRHGIAVQGKPTNELGLDITLGDLKTTMRYNIMEYWPNRLWVLEKQTEQLDDETIVDSVLTLCRILYSLRENDVTSKVHAGRYALKVLGTEWHRIIEDALAIRSGAPVKREKSHESRISEALSFVRHCIYEFPLLL